MERLCTALEISAVVLIFTAIFLTLVLSLAP